MGINSGIIEASDKKYPKALKDALGNLVASLGPKKLYYKGDVSLLEQAEKKCLAVVGSRHLTYYGKKAIEQIVTQCASQGIVIVSGFMYGGDEQAHSATVRCGGKTIAVMPCGIERVHPENQKKLYQEILDTGGLIISEYEGNAMPQNFTYVQRDRLVAGLCRAVFVVEAALDSGSLITASYAKKYNRKIFALPGQITSEVSKGCLKLIKEGAELVTEANDILSFYKVLVNPKKSGGRASPLSLRAEPAGEGVAIQSAGNTLEQKILFQLNREAMNIDDMAHLFSVPVSQLGTTLSLMQLKGQVNLEGGKYFIN